AGEGGGGGGGVDDRGDIFAGGWILFETVTGHKGFGGKDARDSLHKIVYAPIPQINDFKTGAPAELQRVIQRCLAKDPNKRYHSIKDVALVLEEIRQELKSADPETSVPAASSTGGRSAASVRSGIESAQQLVEGVTTTGAFRSTSSAEYLVNEIKTHKRGVLLGGAVLIVLAAGVAFGLYKLLGRKPSVTFGPLKIARLTSTGQVNLATITSDGKYVFYVQDDGEKESLWMTQVTTSSNLQIVAPAEAHYDGLTVSHDGNFLYYVRLDRDNPSGALFRMPALGGNARKLLVNIFSPITLSPDDKRMAFVRCEHCLDAYAAGQKAGERVGVSSLITANSDGSDEKTLTVLGLPDIFSPGGPAWSPDGKTIACGKVHRGPQRGGPHRAVVAVRVSDGTEEPITSQRWS